MFHDIDEKSTRKLPCYKLQFARQPFVSSYSKFFFMENSIIYFNANLIVSYMTKEQILHVLASFPAYTSDIS